MAVPGRPPAHRALSSQQQQSGLSRSSRLDSLSALATASPSSSHPSPPPSPPPHGSAAARDSSTAPPRSRAGSPTPPGSATMTTASSSPPLPLPSPNLPPSSSASSSAQLSPRDAYAQSTHSSHSSTRTNTGFVVTSRPRSYNPPQQPSSPSPSPYLSSSASAAAAAQNAPYPPPVASGSGSGLLSAGLPPSLGLRRGSSPAALPTASRRGTLDDAAPSADGYGSALPSPRAEPKTTLTLSASLDAKGRRMVNQYVRLKTIGQGSHGKVWLCAEPVIREEDEEEEDEGEEGEEGERGEEEGAEEGAQDDGRARRRRRRTPSERWEDDINSGRMKLCAIKSVARDGPGAKSKSLRLAKQGRKASSQGSGGIGSDDKVKREVAIMKRLDHPNIVRLKEVIDDAKSKKVFMVLEFMAGGQVVWQDDNKQPTMTVEQARQTFRDVVLGLEYLHYQGIIHRDIKPANLLWTDDHATVKISDFGVSHVSDALLRCSADDPAACGANHDGDDKALRKTAGSPAFFAPELCHPVEYTPTPTAHAAAKADSPEMDAYFPYGIDSSHVTPPSSTRPDAGGAVYSPPTSPTDAPALSNTLISLPLPPPSPSQPRARPPVGKGIDIWALGVTLYCLLFGDTPFTARTEYELYNVIVREPIRVPLRMGVEGAWTGVPPGFEGAGDGVEGREVVDLLGRLLEKDPTKRITLEEVKQHPWVLRNLPSPDSWLHTADPGNINHVTITDEDVQHATQERGAVDTLPPIRNRPGIRRALNAALARFPAFGRVRSTRTTASEDTAGTGATTGTGTGTAREPRSRSKSNSSTGHSAADGGGTGIPLSETNTMASTVSRHPSDGCSAGGTRPSGKGKLSHEFGAELRRIISGASGIGSSSGGGGENGGTPRSPSPAQGHGTRGGWGNRAVSRKNTAEGVLPVSPTPPTSGFPELARSVSSSSVLGNSASAASGSGVSSRSHSHFSAHHFFGRKQSDLDASTRSGSSLASSPSVRTGTFSPSPWGAGSDTEGGSGGAPLQSRKSTGGEGSTHVKHRTLSRMLSRLGGGGGSSGSGSNSPQQARSTSRLAPDRKFSASSTEEEHEHAAAAAAASSVAAMGVAPGVVEQFEPRERYDALGRLVSQQQQRKKGSDASDSRSLASGLTAAKEELEARSRRGSAQRELDEDDEGVDLTEFEYSESDDDGDDSDDDDLDDFMRPALATGNHLSGWKHDFGDFRIGVRSPSEDDAAGAVNYTSSQGGTPPTDELDPLDEKEAQQQQQQQQKYQPRRPSPPQVPMPDNVSYSFVPLDYQFFPPPSSPLQRVSLGRAPSSPLAGAEGATPRPNGPLLSPHTAQQQYEQHPRAPSPSSPSAFAPLPSPMPLRRGSAFSDRSDRSSFDGGALSPTPRDGSIRGVSLDPPSSAARNKLAGAAALGRAWQQAQEEDEDDGDEEEEMLVVPRRRRAATLGGSGPAGAGSPASPPPSSHVRPAAAGN
ncbi:hypothetical protein JCM6882_005247 [Rhodosporidiobolus microsporus]